MSATLRHAGYVLGENPVTGFAFALFLLFALCAALGPALAPYDPLASDTAAALTGPSAAHWFGTDQLGRDIFSRIIVAARLDLGIAITSVALAFGIGTVAGLVAGYCGGWIDRMVGRAVDTIMAFPLFVLAMGIVAALGNNVANIVYATAIINLPIYARLARAEANVRRDAGFVEAARLCGNSETRIVLGQLLPNIMPLDDGAGVIDAGLRHPERRRSFLHRPGGTPADRGMGHHGRRWRELHRLGRVVGRVLPRSCTDGRRVLLQPDGGRPARYRRPTATHMTTDGNFVPLLAVEDLSIEFRTRSGTVCALDRVGFQLRRGETMALVGESGSGKSVTAYAIMGILDAAARITSGRIAFGGLELLRADKSAIAEMRGRELAIIFQNPRTALNPIRSVGKQIADILLRHGNVTGAQAPGRAD